jgi:hypothetical protein
VAFLLSHGHACVQKLYNVFKNININKLNFENVWEATVPSSLSFILRYQTL